MNDKEQIERAKLLVLANRIKRLAQQTSCMYLDDVYKNAYCDIRDTIEFLETQGMKGKRK